MYPCDCKSLRDIPVRFEGVTLFSSNFDAIIDKSIDVIYIREMKGHLGLHFIRGEKFHISGSRQMWTCDEYRDFDFRPDIF